MGQENNGAYIARGRDQIPNELENSALVGEIFHKARNLLINFGTDSPFKETPGQKIVNLDVEDEWDLRGHTRVNILGDLQSEEIKITYNSNYFQGSYLFTDVTLTKDKVIDFKQTRSEEGGDFTRLYPHHGILPPKYPQTKPNLHEIKKLLFEGKIEQDHQKGKKKKPFWRRILKK